MLPHNIPLSDDVWKQTILQLQSQVHKQERILQERLCNHEHRVLKKETLLAEWERMLKEQEERLDAIEQEVLQRLQEHEAAHFKRLTEMDNTLEERQLERILMDGSE